MFTRLCVLLLLTFSPMLAWAEAETVAQTLNLTNHWVGYTALGIFGLAYLLAMTEEVTELNKSKPMVLAASLIWALIAAVYVGHEMGETAGKAFRACLEGYAELFLFMCY